MTLNSVNLGNRIAAALQAARPADGSAILDNDLQSLWQTIAAEIVTEIQTNGEVTVQTSEGPATGTIQ